MNNQYIDPIERARIRTISNGVRGDVYFQNGSWHNPEEKQNIHERAMRVDSKKKLQDILNTF